MMKNLLIFILLQGVYNDTLTFDVMIMLTFPQLNFIIVIMCSLVFIWSIPFFLYFQQRWTWDADGRSTFPSNFKPSPMHRVFAHSHV